MSLRPVEQSDSVSAEARWRRHGHRGGVLWFTGLSGAGKSSLAIGLERELFNGGSRVFVLDGDNLRHGLNGDLGFSENDRSENIRRVTEVARAYAEAGFIVITAFISPFHADRDSARRAIGANFHEVFIDAAIDVCEERDPKGLYAKARAGEIAEFTGVSSPYEPPRKPELVVDTSARSLTYCVEKLSRYAKKAFELQI